MSYSIKELFYTLQGEGLNAGRAAVFLRFAGCNLWSGRAEDRGRGAGGCSAWCDTDFVGINGTGGGRFESADAVALAVERCWADRSGARFVVCTGGEPLLQLDDAIVDALHARNFEVAVETNGSLEAPKGLDWVCVSPKAGAPVALKQGDELKFVYPQRGLDPKDFEALAFRHFLLQPLDGPLREEHTQQATDYCLRNPKWRLSLQTHKFLGIP